MAALNVTAYVLSKTRALAPVAPLEVGILVTYSSGKPVPGLMESEVEFAVATERCDSWAPTITGVPGPARPLGLAGNYCFTLLTPPQVGGWAAVAVGGAIQVSVQHDGDSGQTVTPVDVEAPG